LKELGLDVNLPALVREVAERDRRDSERAVAPLRPASDAEVLDTTGMTIDEAVARVLSLVRSRLGF
jgi:cytidylate kinase